MSFEPRVIWAEDEAARGEKTRWTNLWIMINTNQARPDIVDRSDLIAMLRRIINQIFGQHNELRTILQPLTPAGDPIVGPQREEEFNKIEQVTSEAVVEVGPRIHRVHSHVLLMIQHKTKLHLRVPELRERIRQLSIVDGEPFIANPVIRFKVIRENPINAIRNYQRGYKGRMPVSLINRVSARQGISLNQSSSS